MKMICGHFLSNIPRLSPARAGYRDGGGRTGKCKKSYMEIQQIRNANLFRYEIECKVEEKSRGC